MKKMCEHLYYLKVCPFQTAKWLPYLLCVHLWLLSIARILSFLLGCALYSPCMVAEKYVVALYRVEYKSRYKSDLVETVIS